MSVVVVPFLMLMTTFSLLVFLFLMGVSFGALFDMIVYSLTRMEGAKKYVIPSVFIPSIGLISVYIIAHFSNDLAIKLSMNLHDPLLVSISYVGAFVLPYVIHKISFSYNYSQNFVL